MGPEGRGPLTPPGTPATFRARSRPRVSLTVSVRPGYLLLVSVHFAAAEVNLGPSLTEALPNGLLVQLTVRGGGPKRPF